MTKEEISEQAWLMHYFTLPKKLPARHAAKQAVDDFKSSLQREIEKRIEELNSTAIHGYITSNTKIAIEENKEFLERLNTVEP